MASVSKGTIALDLLEIQYANPGKEPNICSKPYVTDIAKANSSLIENTVSVVTLIPSRTPHPATEIGNEETKNIKGIATKHWIHKRSNPSELQIKRIIVI